MSLGVLEIPLSKILVVSTERCGSTNFMKTLELTQNGKFWEHPIFNDFKSQIDNIGFREFMDKSYQLSDLKIHELFDFYTNYLYTIQECFSFKFEE